MYCDCCALSYFTHSCKEPGCLPAAVLHVLWICLCVCVFACVCVCMPPATIPLLSHLVSYAYQQATHKYRQTHTHARTRTHTHTHIQTHTHTRTHTHTNAHTDSLSLCQRSCACHVLQTCFWVSSCRSYLTCEHGKNHTTWRGEISWSLVSLRPVNPFVQNVLCPMFICLPEPGCKLNFHWPNFRLFFNPIYWCIFD